MILRRDEPFAQVVVPDGEPFEGLPQGGGELSRPVGVRIHHVAVT